MGVPTLLWFRPPKGSFYPSSIKYLYRDDFNGTLAAGAVNGTACTPGPGTRKIIDTAGNLHSISGGSLIFAGRTGSADPGYWINNTVARTFGRFVVAHVLSQNAGNRVELGWNELNTGVNSTNNMYFVGGNIQFRGLGVTIGTYTANVDNYVAVVLRSTGAYLFAKSSDVYSNRWTLLWVDVARNDANVYPYIGVRSGWGANNNYHNFIRVPQALYIVPILAYDTFTRANGAIGSTEGTGPDGQGAAIQTWTGATWTVSSNAAVNTPTLGLETFADPGLEAAYVAGLCGSLSKTGSPTVAESADVHGGSKAQEFTGAALNNALVYAGGITPALGTIMEVSGWCKRTAGSSGTCNIGIRESGVANARIAITSAAYAQIRTQLRFTGVGTANLDLIELGAAGFDTVIMDDVSLKYLTLSSCIASLQTSTANVLASVDIVYDPNLRTYSGLIVCLDSASNPQNYIRVMIERASNTIKVDKCVGGTFTAVASTAFTYSSGAKLVVVKDSTSVTVYYNNAIIGSISTVSDVGIISNVLHGLFSTDVSNTFDNYAVRARGNGSEYAGLDKYIKGG